MGDEVASPGAEWERRAPEDSGFSAARLEAAWERVRDELGEEGRARVCVVRGGYLAAEWTAGISPDERLDQASAAKSALCSHW